MYTHHFLCSDGDEAKFLDSPMKPSMLYPAITFRDLGYIAHSFRKKSWLLQQEEAKADWRFSESETLEGWSYWHCTIAAEYGRYFTFLTDKTGYDEYCEWCKEKERNSEVS